MCGAKKERGAEAAGAAVVLHILHSADVRAGHSSFPYTRSVGKKYGGSVANGRTKVCGGGEGGGGEGPQAGSPVLYFLPGEAAVAGVVVVAAAAAAASFAQYACQDIF